MILSRCLIPLLVSGLFACGDESTIVEDDPPGGKTVSRDLREELIHDAIRRSLIVKKDVPDYGLLRNRHEIVVSNQILTDGEEPALLEEKALPESEVVTFVLLSPEQIQQRADERGDYLFLHVGDIVIEEGIGEIDLHLSWAQSKDSDVVYLSGGGHRLQYMRMDSTWTFQRVLSAWIS